MKSDVDRPAIDALGAGGATADCSVAQSYSEAGESISDDGAARDAIGDVEPRRLHPEADHTRCRARAPHSQPGLARVALLRGRNSSLAMMAGAVVAQSLGD